MKFINIMLLLACTCNVQAQDFCKHIKKEVTGEKSTEYTSPSDPAKNTPIVIKRMINTDPDMEADNFMAIFQMINDLDSKTAEDEKPETHFIIEFDDKSKIVDDTTRIDHEMSEDRTMITRTVYFPITSDVAKSFTTKKISKFSMAGYNRTMPADTANMVMHYVDCIKAGK